MNEPERILYKELKASNIKGIKININLHTRYFRLNQFLLGATTITEVNGPEFGDNTTEFEKIPLLGYDDLISGYVTTFEHIGNVPAIPGPLNPPPVNVPEPVLIRYIITSNSQTSITINGGYAYIDYNIRTIINGNFKNGDILLLTMYDFSFRPGNESVVYFSETLIKSDTMPLMAFTKKCEEGKIDLIYFQVQPILDNNFIAATFFPIQAVLPFYFIKQDLSGVVNVDSITPNVFLSSDAYNLLKFEFPIYINLKDISIGFTRNHMYNSFNIQLIIKN